MNRKLFISGLILGLAILNATSIAQDAATDIADSPALVPPNKAPAEESSEPKATTISNPKIPIEYLKLLLEPLPKDELVLEVQGWQELLKLKMLEIAEHEISSQVSGDAGDAASEKAVSLISEKGEITERFRIAIDAFADKGGDPAPYNQYYQISLGYNINSADKSAIREAFARWLKSESGGKLVLRRLTAFLVILAITWLLSGIIGKFVSKAVERQEAFSNLLKTFIKKTVRRTILFIGLLVAITALGVNVSALFAMIGGGAFIIGFALQDTLSNLAAGIMVLVYRPFDVGDLVELGGVEGTVDSVSLVSTTIRSFDNKVVLVPNKSVWGQVITNATASDKRRVDLVFGIGYEDDTDKAQQILEKLVERHELILDDPEPIIRIHELADSSVNFICRPWTRPENYWTVYWDLTEEVKEAFDANGVSIPYPQQDVHYHEAKS